MKAIQRLMRGPDGRMKIVYIDLETLSPITDLTGYDIVNQSSGYVEEVQNVDEPDPQPMEKTPAQPGTAGGGGGGGAVLGPSGMKPPGSNQFPEAPQQMRAPTSPVQRSPLPPPTTQPQTPVMTPRVPATAPNPQGQGFARLVPEGYGLEFYRPGQENIKPELSDALQGTSRELDTPLGITSGFRSPDYNRQVGGAPKSFHTQGLAADVDLSGLSESERQQLVQELTQRGAGGFITYTDSPDMLHVDMRPSEIGTGPHFMHDRTSAHMENAPSWFQQMAAGQGTLLPGVAPVPTAAPRGEAKDLIGFAPSREGNKSTASRAIESILQGEKSQNKENNLTHAQTAALGAGNYFEGLTDDELSAVAMAVAGELSPDARASIASGNPSEEAVGAMGGILSTMTNRAGSSGKSLYDITFQPKQYSAVNPSFIDATKEMYEPVAPQMDKAVRDYFSGSLADRFGLSTVVPNPTATNYFADYVSPPWASAMQDVSKDSTGHVFGNLSEYGSPYSSYSTFKDDRSSLSEGFAPSSSSPFSGGSSSYGIATPEGGYATATSSSSPFGGGGGSVTGGSGFSDSRSSPSSGFGSGSYGISTPSGGYSSVTGGSNSGGFTSDTYGGTSPQGSGVSPSSFGGALSGI